MSAILIYHRTPCEHNLSRICTQTNLALVVPKRMGSDLNCMEGRRDDERKDLIARRHGWFAQQPVRTKQNIGAKEDLGEGQLDLVLKVADLEVDG